LRYFLDNPIIYLRCNSFDFCFDMDIGARVYSLFFLFDLFFLDEVWVGLFVQIDLTKLYIFAVCFILHDGVIFFLQQCVSVF